MKIKAILESGKKSGSKKTCFILKYVVSYKGIKFRIVRSGTILICSFGNQIRQFALKCAGKQKTKETEKIPCDIFRLTVYYYALVCKMAS